MLESEKKKKEKPEAVLHLSTSVCSVIVNAEEWRCFKDMTKTCTPLEVEMFHMKEDGSTPQVYLRPRESVHIPLKYQSFVSGHALLSQVNFLSGTIFFQMLSLYIVHKAWTVFFFFFVTFNQMPQSLFLYVVYSADTGQYFLFLLWATDVESAAVSEFLPIL